MHERARTKNEGKPGMIIRSYAEEDETEVIELWRKCNLARPQNNPKLDIERKLAVNPELFLVGLIEGRIVASVMGGYEGHRGWINYLGVDPNLRKQGLGRQIMNAVESVIRSKGCPKINLQVRKDNLKVMRFYEAIGYKMDEVVSMGKRLVKDSDQR
jgi:ribosomal protein S18 acetylase RimI-like enzyme